MIMVDVYHEFEFPYKMMRKMVPTLKKGGQTPHSPTPVRVLTVSGAAGAKATQS